MTLLAIVCLTGLLAGLISGRLLENHHWRMNANNNWIAIESHGRLYKVQYDE